MVHALVRPRTLGAAHLTQYDERGWRATFYTTGMEHSPTSATGTAWERTPWHVPRCPLLCHSPGTTRHFRIL